MKSLDSQLLITPSSHDYALLDSGDGEKLERYGRIVLSRPDPQALWPKFHPAAWADADGTFSRSAKAEWKMNMRVPARWDIELGGIRFLIRPTAFKHTGVFPEQASNWQWMAGNIKAAKRPISVLNLFGYTGGATLACSSAGASVTHVDGSKVAIGWAKDNAAVNGIADNPIRWILDDARAFVEREIRRGNRYDAIILDPPSFGHGPKGEMWKIENDFIPLLRSCGELLSKKPLFFLVNGYAAGYSPYAYAAALRSSVPAVAGKGVSCGEMAIASEDKSHILPCGIYARWSAH